MATLNDRYEAGCATLDDLGQQIAAHEADLQALRDVHMRLGGRLDELAALQALGLGLTIIPAADAAAAAADDAAAAAAAGHTGGRRTNVRAHRIPRYSLAPTERDAPPHP